MKKYGIFIVAIIALAVIITSCGGGGGGVSNSPSKTVEKVYSMMMKKDFDKLVTMYAGKDGAKFSEEDMAKLKAMLPMAVKEFESKGGLKSVEILNEKIADLEKAKKYGFEHEHARVQINQVFGNGMEEKDLVYLVKAADGWKVLPAGPGIDF